MQGFHLPTADTKSLKRKREEAQLQRNAHLLVVPGFASILTNATEALRRASPSTSFSMLIPPLLLVSGRRLTEICSPRSVFAPTSSEYHAQFQGALKKKGRTPTFVIPLLVPYELFASALAVLRQKQANTVSELDNRRIKTRYQANAARGLQNALPGMPACKLHDLRATYASAVNLLFRCPHSINYTTCKSLCHDHLYESLSYSHVRLEGVGDLAGSLGALDAVGHAADAIATPDSSACPT